VEKPYRCLICGVVVSEEKVNNHKQNFHFELRHYGLMWPLNILQDEIRDLRRTPIHDSAIIARVLGVRRVYIKDEGMNYSGSMKDYSVERAVRLGSRAGFRSFFVVSSGNHAVALAKYVAKTDGNAIVFTPATSSKINMLSAMPKVYVVGVRNAIFEDVYSLVAGIELKAYYNANVSNELLLAGFAPVAKDIMALDPLPTHILAGVGNGSYLAGISLAWQNAKQPKIVPVGMAGAFPTEAAFEQDKNLVEYTHFYEAEQKIDAAEGSIAIASYSMPQLMRAVYQSGGFPLGNILNKNLGKAYHLLMADKQLVETGSIPEPTGIMGLAAALKHRKRFTPDDVLLIAFTGHGAKDLEGIRRVAGRSAPTLIGLASKARPDLLAGKHEADLSKVLFVDKNIAPKDLEETITAHIKQGGG
jgi:threonine synthase